MKNEHISLDRVADVRDRKAQLATLTVNYCIYAPHFLPPLSTASSHLAICSNLSNGYWTSRLVMAREGKTGREILETKENRQQNHVISTFERRWKAVSNSATVLATVNKDIILCKTTKDNHSSAKEAVNLRIVDYRFFILSPRS
jgi:hypothetical protein